MLESSIERAVGEHLRVWARVNYLPLHYIKFSPVGVRGWPDRVVLWGGGNLLFLELKRRGQKPRKLQEHIHNQLRICGFKVLVHDDTDECLAEIKREILATGRTGSWDGVDSTGGGG